jgi:ribonuclease R
VSDNTKPVELSRFLTKVEDAPEADFINELLLRSMKKAVYQRENIGHFGLAFKHYTHFTSPIRRYPDLLVHRLLRAVRYKEFKGAYAKRMVPVIDMVGSQCSDTERNSEAAERQAIKVKQVSYMADHLGEEYNGVISGVTSYGFFVRLDTLGVEGLVRMSTIDDDYYRYEEKNYRIVGSRHGKTYRLGDPVRVAVLAVDKVASEIDLYVTSKRGSGPVKAGKSAKKSKPGFAGRKKRKKSNRRK